MAKGKKAVEELSPEEKLEQSLIPVDEQPYSVPENWCWTTLGAYIGFATDYVANGSFASLKANVQICKEENYALMVKTADFANGFSKSLTYTDKHGYDYLEKSVLHGGELILSNIGSIGKVFRVPFLNRPMTLASNLIMIKCYNEQDYDWLYYFFLSPIGLEELLSITTGTAVLKFNKTDLKTIALPVPPLHEQRRIVDRIESLFAKLDEAKEKAQAVVDSFELRKSAILHMAFTGELTERWRKEHGVGLDSWQKTNIGSIADVKGGKRVPKGMSLTTDDTGHPYIKAGNLKLGTVLDEGIMFVPDDVLQYIKNYTVTAGDVYITNVGACIGDCGVIPDKYDGANLTENAVKITNLKCDGHFLSWYISSNEVQQRIKNLIASATLGKLSIANIKTMPVSLPTKEEQQEIVCILKGLQSREQQAKSAAESVFDQIDTIKKVILARAFRGELGTNDPAEEWAGELVTRIGDN